MRVLLIGDVFGKPGRRALRERLKPTVEKHCVDLVVVNAENAAGGFGLTPDVARELFDLGADVLTGGNHSWDKQEALPLYETDARVLRPHNYPPGNVGTGLHLQVRAGVPVAVINLQGRVFMPTIDCPFQAADRLLETIAERARVIIVDIHAEASSEKQALARYLDGRVSCVVGTHTHVQTADEVILPRGTAYLTDLGMTGPHDSIIGSKLDQSIQRFLTARSAKFEPATGDVRFHGAVIEIDAQTGLARSIVRVQDRLEP